MDNKTRKKFIAPAWIVICTILINAIPSIFRISLLQQYGARTYDTLLTVIHIVSVAAIVVAIILCATALYMFYKNKQEEESWKRKADAIEQENILKKSRERAKLSISNPLDTESLKYKLTQYTQSEWGALYSYQIPEYLSMITDQLNDMDGYQQKLDTLLGNNGASYLNDTSDLLEKVEQYLLRNIRKIINCLDIYESDNADDCKKLEDLLAKIYLDNQSQLKNVKEFLVVTTDFLNQQGDDDTDIQKLNLYKDTILESISE